LELINSEKFAYVNLHCHAMGSYHAQGGLGGHGNAAAVKRALELDMGVFNISPLDKGGRLGVGPSAGSQNESHCRCKLDVLAYPGLSYRVGAVSFLTSFANKK
jgi:predicted aldo/keto reductase-like oxidoreductase